MPATALSAFSAAVLLAAAPVIAAAPLDRSHAALLSALVRGDGGAGCTSAQLRAAAAGAALRSLGRVEGDEVVLAAVEASCLCGAQNCPYYALRLGAGAPRVLLSTFGIDAKTRPGERSAALPAVVVRAHDSALVSVESVYAYRNGRYDTVREARVRGSDGARKPGAPVPVRFAAGASSAPLRGTVSLGWEDAYAFAASKGQRLLIDGVRSPERLRLTLFVPPGGSATSLRAGVPFALPASGTYRLNVETDAESDAPYALTLAIRP
ncbi:MAG: hypothetical protein QOI11_3615 [Candidatus Eremiobacteraeota bacterium]|nr:hypothetical protein [Candidatus Eremiobacteraeota bacterium]